MQVFDIKICLRAIVVRRKVVFLDTSVEMVSNVCCRIEIRKEFGLFLIIYIIFDCKIKISTIFLKKNRFFLNDKICTKQNNLMHLCRFSYYIILNKIPDRSQSNYQVATFSRSPLLKRRVSRVRVVDLDETLGTVFWHK